MSLDDSGLRSKSPASGYARATTGYQIGAVDDSEHEKRTTAMRSEFKGSLSTSGSELVESLKLLEVVVLYGLYGAARKAARYTPMVYNNRQFLHRRIRRVSNT